MKNTKFISRTLVFFLQRHILKMGGTDPATPLFRYPDDSSDTPQYICFYQFFISIVAVAPYYYQRGCRRCKVLPMRGYQGEIEHLAPPSIPLLVLMKFFLSHLQQLERKPTERYPFSSFLFVVLLANTSSSPFLND